MVSDKVFTTDGTQKIFSSDFDVISEDHIRVFLGSAVVSRDDYDLINNAAVFFTPPTTGQTLTLQVGTTPADILTSPTDAGIVAANITDVNTVAGSITDVNTVATNIADVNTAAANITDIQNAAANAAAAAASATAAATSETNAATSETNAAASETAAQAAQAATESLFDQFGDQYLGSHSSDPTTDNDGDPLNDGDIYWNTTDNVLKFYTGTAWVAPEDIATTAANNAQASATAAATSETNAATSETNAASSASAAATSASNAATSETNAATSATNAATSETNAAASATSAQAALASINGTYLGAQTSDPSVDLNGNAVTAGDWYFNTTNNVTRIYDGSAWQNGAVSTTNFVQKTGDTMTGNLTAPDFIGPLDGPVRFKAQNDEGSTITAGQVVYIKGITGNTPTVGLADASNSSKMPAFGLVYANANDQAAVEIVSFGTLGDIKTDYSGWSLGDTLYVSTTAGTLTNSAPAGESNLIQNIGKIQRLHGTAGSIKVGGAGRTNATPNLDDGNVFIGNSSNQATTTPLSSVADAAGTGVAMAIALG